MTILKTEKDGKAQPHQSGKHLSLVFKIDDTSGHSVKNIDLEDRRSSEKVPSNSELYNILIFY